MEQEEKKFGWRLIFTEGLVDNFFDLKEVGDIRAFREGSNNFKKGQIIAGHFMQDGGFALALEIVEDTLVIPLGNLPADKRDLWGKLVRPHTLLLQMLETMRGYYPDMTKDTVIAFNKIRLVRGQDGHVVYKTFPDELREQLRNRN